MSQDRIEVIERQIGELTSELAALRKASEAEAIRNYEFETGAGKTTLLDLFADKDRLLVIHNMGQGCRYCTLWADGFNGLLPHLESALSVVLVSKDPPDVQRTFANSRGWRFRLASHGGGDYIREQGVYGEAENYPGAVVYERGNGDILRKNACSFGPGDLYCALWPLLALAGLVEFTPQFNYWKRPERLEDGGENILD
ncbi:MAG: DUF899 family protein [Gammaproteobacteria bacterium]|nr:DUF899 family protein [Gammaproteobacteria bacterium]MDE0442526.1 DUF899 family protein [Gammaproteobacteria bacterium]